MILFLLVAPPNHLGCKLKISLKGTHLPTLKLVPISRFTLIDLAFLDPIAINLVLVDAALMDFTFIDVTFTLVLILLTLDQVLF